MCYYSSLSAPVLTEAVFTAHREASLRSQAVGLRWPNQAGFPQES